MRVAPFFWESLFSTEQRVVVSSIRNNFEITKSDWQPTQYSVGAHTYLCTCTMYIIIIYINKVSSSLFFFFENLISVGKKTSIKMYIPLWKEREGQREKKSWLSKQQINRQQSDGFVLEEMDLNMLQNCVNNWFAHS